MVQLFRINDPFRILAVFALLLLVRLPLIFDGLPMTTPELNWLLLGEQLAAGKSMYTDIWDFTGPFSTGVYWLLHELFGKTRTPFFTLSVLLVTFQAMLFNRYLIRLNIYKEKTYLPALLYVVGMSISFDFFTLTPVLMALTFLLLMLQNIFRLDEQAIDQAVFRTGVYLGIAVLFYLPSLLFLLLALPGLALFRTSSVRYLLMLVYGFAFVLSLWMLYLYIDNGLEEFYRQYLGSYFAGNYQRYISGRGLLLLFAVPAAVLLMTIVRVRSERGFINFQVSCQQIMVIWLVVSVATLFFNHRIAPFQLQIFVPAICFFGAHFLLLLRKRLLAELYFWLVSLLVIGNLLNQYYNWLPVANMVSYNKLLVHKKTADLAGYNRVLVLGEETGYYQNKTFTTPYLNWDLARRHFGQLENYQVLVEIYQNFEKDLPEIIIDTTPDRLSEKLFDRMPLLASKYRQAPAADAARWYVLKDTARASNTGTN